MTFYETTSLTTTVNWDIRFRDQKIPILGMRIR